MKLYDLSQSFNNRKVRAVAFELGIDLEIMQPNLMKGEHKQAEFLEKNPNGKMPVLEDGDFLLWESHAILLYLVDQKPESILSPKSAKQRAEVNKWLFWDSCHLNKSISSLTQELILKKLFGGGEPDEAKVAMARNDLKQQAKLLDDHLAKHEYLANSLSVADFSLASDLAMRNFVGFDLSNFSNLKSWLERIESRESWKKSEPVYNL